MKSALLSTIHLPLASSRLNIFCPTAKRTPLILIGIPIAKFHKLHSRKENAKIQPFPKLSHPEEANLNFDSEEEEEEDGDYDDELLIDELDDGLIEDEESEEFEGEFEDEEEEQEPRIGDGGGGGGVSLGGTSWDKEALRIAEQVCTSFNGELAIYAFRTSSNSTIQVRIERLTNKSGSPGMDDIERFSRAYRALLDEAEVEKMIPENITLEVSSPGVERVVRVPADLERFKERAMYVKYAKDEDPLCELEGVFALVSVDLEERMCTWRLADVRANREKSGKGRPLSKKQREWSILLPFTSILLVKIYSQC